jgi:hypothetical protein
MGPNDRVSPYQYYLLEYTLCSHILNILWRRAKLILNGLHENLQTKLLAAHGKDPYGNHMQYQLHMLFSFDMSVTHVFKTVTLYLLLIFIAELYTDIMKTLSEDPKQADLYFTNAPVLQ